MSGSDLDSSILRLARWAARNCPESLENEAAEFLHFEDKQKDVVWIEREQFERIFDLFDRIVFKRGNSYGVSLIGRYDEAIALYDLIYAGRINDDDDAPAGSP